MPANIYSMAYNKVQAPWHGLGNAVDSNMTPEQMLIAAGLDWNVSKRLVRMRINKESDAEMVIPGYQAIVRDSDNFCFQVASERYKPIQNKDILQFFREYCEAGEMNLETAGALGNGGVIWALAKVNHGSGFDLPGKDRVESYVLLANSHDGTLVFTAQPTSIRVVCMNTLGMAIGEGKDKANTFRMKHSKKFDATVANDAKKKVGIFREKASKFKEVASKLSETKVEFGSQVVKEYILRLTQPGLLETVIAAQENRATGKGILDNIVQDQETSDLVRHIQEHRITDEDLNRVGRGILESITNSPGSKLESAKDTWWGVVNGVTHYTDHESGRERDTALQSAWFGAKATLKQSALEMAIEYTESQNRRN